MKRRSPLYWAKVRGLEAQLAGEPRDACPYEDKRTWRGSVTWSRAFRTAWLDGWDEAARDRGGALVTAKYARG